MDSNWGVLDKLKKKSILATDISGQFWCELQMELNYLHGRDLNAAMKGGTKVHKELQAQVAVAVEIKPLGYPDFLFKEAYENYLSLKNLNENGIGREIKVYGSINGFKISGKIDELKMVDGKVVIVETKTKALNGKAGNVSDINESTMRTHKVQIMLYKKLLEDLKNKEYTYKNFYISYGIQKMELSPKFLEQLDLVGIDKSLRSLDSVYKAMYEQLYLMAQVSDTLVISYVERSSGEEFASVSIEYNKADFDKVLSDAMGYWLGERAARPVSKEESWKCTFCKFNCNQCKVWCKT